MTRRRAGAAAYPENRGSASSDRRTPAGKDDIATEALYRSDTTGRYDRVARFVEIR